MIEEVSWYDWEIVPLTGVGGQHIYLGDAICEKRLPTVAEAMDIVSRLCRQDVKITLVTPLVTDKGLIHTVAMVDALMKVFRPLEVVCNDWGIFDLVASMSGCIPIVGRLLAHQETDPRWYGISAPKFQTQFEREVQHFDGTVARLCYQPPPPQLLQHIRCCSLDQPEVFQYLSRRGVNRMELNNPLQGITVSPPSGWHLSLHVPDVLITLARNCLNIPVTSSETEPWACDNGCPVAPIVWKHESFLVELYQLTNGVYYFNSDIPRKCQEMGVDRIIRRMWRS